MLLSKSKKLKIALLLSVVIFAAIAVPFSDALAVTGEEAPPTEAQITAAKEDGKGTATKAPSLWDMLSNPELALAYIIYMVLQMAAAFMLMAAEFLNTVIGITILNLANFLAPSALGESIATAWAIIRDIINIVFVFLLLFVGINTILGSMSDSRFTTKLIPKILLVALLINFSMVFTKFFIDVSNIVTIEFYNVIQRQGQESTFKQGNNETKIKQGLAGSIMNNLNVQAFYDARFDPENTNQNINMQVAIGMFMGVFVVLMATFVFLVVGFMLLSRFVAFIVLLVTSPVMFMGQLLPQLKPHVDKWWSTLWGQALFAPIFFAMLLVVITVLNGNIWGTITSFNADGWAGAAKNYFNGGITIVMRFFIVMFLLMTALTTAKKVAGDAGKGITDWGSKMAGAATFGLAARAGQRTVGALGSKVAESERFKKMARSDNFATSLVGKGLVNTGAWTAQKSFDFRAVAGDLGAGSVKKGGYEQWKKDGAKAQTKQYERYGSASKESQQGLDRLKTEELRAKEAVRLAQTPEERTEKIEALAVARKQRKTAEKTVKREKAQSLQNVAYRDQQTVKTARGRGLVTTGLRKAGTLWDWAVNPGKRGAAEDLEKKVAKDARDTGAIDKRKEEVAAIDKEIAALKEQHAKANRTGVTQAEESRQKAEVEAKEKAKKDLEEKLKALTEMDEEATKAEEKEDFMKSLKKAVKEMQDADKGSAESGEKKA